MAHGLFWKENVPSGATLHAQVSPTQDPDTWNADLFLRTNDGQMAAHRDNAALRANAIVALAGANPEHYWGQLVLTFPGPSSCRVELWVEKPGGALHGKVYDEIHANDPADAIAVAVFMA